MFKISIFDMNDKVVSERPILPNDSLDWWVDEIKRQIHDPQNVNMHLAGFEVLESAGDTWERFRPNNPITRYDVREQGTPTDRIENLLDEIKMYLDPEKYTFDFVKVEQLLMEASQVVENTARGVRPKNLPLDVPFSDSLDEDNQSGPFTYAGDMSLEEYEQLQRNYEMDRHTVVVYQSPDRKHCALERRDNDGNPDETTGAVGKRYALPKGYSNQSDSVTGESKLQFDADPNQEVYIDNNDFGKPAIYFDYGPGVSYQLFKKYSGLKLDEPDLNTVIVSQPQNAPEQALDEYPMPDPNLTVADLEARGYLYGDLLPLSKDQALSLFKEDLAVFTIKDGDAKMAYIPEEIQEHNGMFAVRRNGWEESREFSAAIENRMMHQEQREAAFLQSSQDAFAIYQIKDGEEHRDIRFEPLDWLESKGIAVDHRNYDLAYTSPLTDRGSTGEKLEILWDRFNNDHPADFQRPSPSVSDVIALKQNGVVSCHYVDRFGFKEVKAFLKPEKQAAILSDKLASAHHEAANYNTRTQDRVNHSQQDICL